MILCEEYSPRPEDKDSQPPIEGLADPELAILAGFADGLTPPPPPDFGPDNGGPGGSLQPPSEQDRQHAIEERQLKAQATEKIMAVLNPEQVEIWNSMIGRPFNGLILPEHFRNRGHH